MHIPVGQEYLKHPEKAKKDFKNLSPGLKAAMILIAIFFIAVLVGATMK